MFNQNKYRKHFIASVAYTVLSAIALVSGGICARGLFSLSESGEGMLGVVFTSFALFVLFMIYCVSAMVLSMLGAGFAIPAIKANYLKKGNIAILVCNIIQFVAETLLLIWILTNPSLAIPPYV